MLVLYWITIFVSAALLFLIQPMFAKMVLPLLGGVPAVWNTFMVFFQASLLLGYGYTHATINWLGTRRQAVLHVVLILIPLAVLPVGVPEGWIPPVKGNPVPWLLALLLVSVGLPFFIASTSGPMLQKWFAEMGHRSSRDPYFLYGASNLGSMLALVGYPLLLEPNLRLAEQSWVWAVGYGVLVLLVLGCAFRLWRTPLSSGPNLLTVETSNEPGPSVMTETGSTKFTGAPIRWVALSFAPSSLMLGVTTYLTTDLPTVPLLWMIPLLLYLLTFVLVFARRPLISQGLMARVLPLSILPLVVWMLLKADEPLWLAILLQLITFFVIAMVCHGELALSRPPSQGLTGFYMWLAMGSVLGGLFNAVIAPVIFTLPIEYPLAIVVGCLLGTRAGWGIQERVEKWLDLLLPLAFGVLFAGLIWTVDHSRLKTGILSVSLMFGLPLLVCFSFRTRPVRFGLAIGCLFLAPLFYQDRGRVLHNERTFFGSYRVIRDMDNRFHLFTHGNINHGMQSLNPTQRHLPLTYYTRKGPIGQVFETFSSVGSNPRVAVVGLGTGSLACHGTVDQEFIFYEIDPAVERIAREPRFFTYLRDCPPNVEVVLGDARITLKHVADGHFGLIILDAFTSDSVPLHLLTREAMRLYLTKLNSRGVLAFHISNQYLDLEPILGDLAQEADLDCISQEHRLIGRLGRTRGKLASRWVVMARHRGDLLGLAEDRRWGRCLSGEGERIWTDDFSNILRVIRW